MPYTVQDVLDFPAQHPDIYDTYMAKLADKESESVFLSSQTLVDGETLDRAKVASIWLAYMLMAVLKQPAIVCRMCGCCFSVRLASGQKNPEEIVVGYVNRIEETGVGGDSPEVTEKAIAILKFTGEIGSGFIAASKELIDSFMKERKRQIERN